MSFISITVTLKVPQSIYPPGPGRQPLLPALGLGEAGSTTRDPLSKGLTCTKRFCSPMTKDSTCDVPSGARTVSSGAGSGQAPEGTSITRADEKLCCRAVRRKRKIAAESKKPVTSSPCLLPHLHPTLSEGENNVDNSGATIGWSGAGL